MQCIKRWTPLCVVSCGVDVKGAKARGRGAQTSFLIFVLWSVRHSLPAWPLPFPGCCVNGDLLEHLGPGAYVRPLSYLRFILAQQLGASYGVCCTMNIMGQPGPPSLLVSRPLPSLLDGRLMQEVVP